mmetsp:Transcript_31888/g.62399  ORF Transcript_31888/g.62399 Transcript_31888/m.62399 type:complete len:109 (+) Transcript_31888:82-408(+)
MSETVVVPTHSQERRPGLIDPDYASPAHRRTVVEKVRTNARRILLHHLPKQLIHIVKYLGDFIYCWCDTMQVFERDSTSVQWAKASGALVAAFCSIHLRWNKMFKLQR